MGDVNRVGRCSACGMSTKQKPVCPTCKPAYDRGRADGASHGIVAIMTLKNDGRLAASDADHAIEQLRRLTRQQVLG